MTAQKRQMASQKFCELRPVAGLMCNYSKCPSSNLGYQYITECIVVSLVSDHLVLGYRSGFVCKRRLSLERGGGGVAFASISTCSNTNTNSGLCPLRAFSCDDRGQLKISQFGRPLIEGGGGGQEALALIDDSTGLLLDKTSSLYQAQKES
jgi:hypothetical protein